MNNETAPVTKQSSRAGETRQTQLTGVLQENTAAVRELSTAISQPNEDQIAAQELVAETAEKQVTASKSQTSATDENTLAVRELVSTMIAEATSRRDMIRQKIENQQPIVRYSEQAEQKPEVAEKIATPIVKEEIKAAKPEKSESSKFKREKPETSVVSAIGTMGLEIAKGIRDAAKDFTQGIADTVGNEIIPLYPQLKQAVTTVSDSVVKAAKIGGSAFIRKKEDKKPAVSTESKSMFERVVTSTNSSEKVVKINEIKQAHRDHKLLKKVDDIYDFMKIKALIDVLGNVKFMAVLAGIGMNLITGFGLFAEGGLIYKMWDGIKSTMTSAGKVLSDMWEGIKKWLDGMKNGVTKLAGEAVDKVKSGYQTAKDFIFGEEPKPMIDKDGKPVIGEDGKPKFSKQVQNTEGSVSKFEKTVSSDSVRSSTMNTVEKVGVEATETGAKSAGKSLLAEGISSIMSGLKSLMKGLGPLAGLFAIEDVAMAASYATGQGEEFEKVNERRYSKQGLDDVRRVQAGLPPASQMLDMTDEQVKKAEKAAVERREQMMLQAQKASVIGSGNTTVINNNSSVASRPFSFAPDELIQHQRYGIQQR